MSVDKYIDLYRAESVKKEKKTKSKPDAVNQADVLREAHQILESAYGDVIVRHMKTKDDRDYFLKSLAVTLGQAFPRKKERKKNKENKTLKYSWLAWEYGFNYWRSSEYKKLSEAEKKKWIKIWKAKMPWLAFDDVSSEALRAPETGIKFYATSRFKNWARRNKDKFEAMKANGIPTNNEEYQKWCKNTYPDQYAAWNKVKELGPDVPAPAEDD
jgi:hypothetical protein